MGESRALDSSKLAVSAIFPTLVDVLDVSYDVSIDRVDDPAESRVLVYWSNRGELGGPSLGDSAFRWMAGEGEHCLKDQQIHPEDVHEPRLEPIVHVLLIAS